MKPAGTKDVYKRQEAFRGLDAEQRARLLSASRRWWRDTTLVWVTHHVADTLDWDRVIVVEDGRIAEDGNPHDLMRSEGAYARLVRDSEQVSEQLRPGADWAVVEVADGTVGPVTGRGPIPWEKAEAGKQSAGSRLSDEAPPDGRARRRIVIGWIAVGIAAMAGGLDVYKRQPPGDGARSTVIRCHLRQVYPTVDERPEPACHGGDPDRDPPNDDSATSSPVGRGLI